MPSFTMSWGHTSCALLVATLALDLPARTFYVSPAGDDSTTGTETAPFRTIQRAADSAGPSDTVLVGPGIYRERVAPPRGGVEGKPITYRSEVAHAAIIRGSDVWAPTWHRHRDGIWFGVPDEGMFTDRAHRDGANPFKILLSSTPWGRNGRPEQLRGYPASDPAIAYTLGQVFVDGVMFLQVPLLTELEQTPLSWFYDAATGRLYVHFADDTPTRHEVEITVRRRIIAPHQRGLGYIAIDGFVLEHCGNQYPTNFWEAGHPEWQQAGALGTRSGHHWTITNNIIRLANGIGVDLGNEGNPTADLELGDNGKATGAGYHILENNYLIDNGAAGTAGYNPTHVVIRGNIIERNNSLRFTGKKRWESAGLKLHHPDFALIERNLVRDNYGQWGIWLDGGAGRETRVLANVVINHGVGLDYEIGDAAPSIAANNIFIANDVAVGMRESGGVAILHNLVLGSRLAGVKASIDRERAGNWNAAHISLCNNLFIGGASFLELTPPTELRSGDYRLDYNVYTMGPSDRKLAFTQQSAVGLAAWQQQWREFNGDLNCDQHSRALPGSTYGFNPATFDLTLTFAFAPAEAAVVADARVPTDFTGTTVEASGPRFPGPFQSLRAGENRFRIWTGIPPLANSAAK